MENKQRPRKEPDDRAAKNSPKEDLGNVTKDELLTPPENLDQEDLPDEEDIYDPIPYTKPEPGEGP